MSNLEFAYQGFTFPTLQVGNDNTFIKELYDSTFNTVHRGRRTLSNKIGRLAGKVTKFFRKKETKVASIISFWSVETIITLMILASGASVPAIIFTCALYAYETYSLFSLLAVQTMM